MIQTVFKFKIFKTVMCFNYLSSLLIDITSKLKKIINQIQNKWIIYKNVYTFILSNLLQLFF